MSLSNYFIVTENWISDRYNLMQQEGGKTEHETRFKVIYNTAGMPVSVYGILYFHGAVKLSKMHWKSEENKSCVFGRYIHRILVALIWQVAVKE